MEENKSEKKGLMEVKKSKSADLENKKSTSLLIGYVLVLAAMFVCFEWTQRDKKIDLSDAVQDVVLEEEVVPITQQEEKLPPPPPEAPSVVEEIKIVDNDTKLEESSIQSTEDTKEAAELPPPVTKKEEPKVVVEEAEDEQQIFQVVETMPDFPGGTAALMQYLGKNIKYPTISQENGVQGRVIVQFVVNKDGSVVDPVVVRSVDPYLDKEAIRVISAMPKWSPGKQRGKPVRVKYTVPVTFKLQ